MRTGLPAGKEASDEALQGPDKRPPAAAREVTLNSDPRIRYPRVLPQESIKSALLRARKSNCRRTKSHRPCCRSLVAKRRREYPNRRGRPAGLQANFVSGKLLRANSARLALNGLPQPLVGSVALAS